MVEPLSQRELEILKLITQGLANREIGERLFLALDTVKGHNRRIFDKLQVQSRTEAIARARELGLLSAQVSVFLNLPPQSLRTTPPTNTKVSIH